MASSSAGKPDSFGALSGDLGQGLYGRESAALTGAD
jgi:hypothetical protein